MMSAKASLLLPGQRQTDACHAQYAETAVCVKLPATMEQSAGKNMRMVHMNMLLMKNFA